MRANSPGACPTNVSSYRPQSRFASSQAKTSAPLFGLSDQLVEMSRTRRPASGARASGGWKIAGSTAFGISDRRLELDPQRLMCVQAVPRLDDGRVRELPVELGDACVRAVVEAPVRAYRPVDAMHHPAVSAREAAEPPEVEVEGVEQADRSPARDPIQLDGQVTPLELPDERSQELVPSTRWRRRELVEESEVGTSAPSRTKEVNLGPDLTRDGAARPAGIGQARLLARVGGSRANRRRARGREQMAADRLRVVAPGQVALDGLARTRSQLRGLLRVGQQIRDGVLERGEVSRRDEAAVDPVLQVVAARDRGSTGHDDRLPARHRLEQRRGRTRVAVVPHREHDDARPRQAVAHDRERDVGLHRDVARHLTEGLRTIPGHDDPEGAVGQAARELEKQVDVPPGIGSDRDDIGIGRAGGSGRKYSVSTPKGTNAICGPASPSHARSASTSPQP